MLSFQNNPKEVEEMQNIINSGKFFSITFIKADNSIRFVNGHKVNYQSTSPETELRGKFNRLDANILLVWDNNKINDKTGEKGAYISAKLDRILFFKAGSFNKDFTEENIDAIRTAGISPNDIQKIKAKMKIGDIVQEEMMGMYEEFDREAAIKQYIEGIEVAQDHLANYFNTNPADRLKLESSIKHDVSFIDIYIKGLKQILL
jgi:hypothetical protein